MSWIDGLAMFATLGLLLYLTLALLIPEKFE